MSPSFKITVGRSRDRKNADATKARKQRPAPTATKPSGPVRVRLDARTIVTLASADRFPFWLQRYPNAHIID